MPLQQLLPGVSLRDDATFENFYVAANGPNRQVIQALKHQLEEQGSFIFCWGASGSGVSHLLQAACHWAGRSAQFLPLSEVGNHPAERLLDGIENFNLVCLDRVDSILGNGDWEQALFNLMNRVRDRRGHLLMGANTNPNSLSTEREDLRSRFTWGAVYQVESLDDEGKKHALQLRAKARGINLSDEVANYILQRIPRDTAGLFNLLDQLDKKSLESQRRLTIPFVKKIVDGLRSTVDS